MRDDKNCGGGCAYIEASQADAKKRERECALKRSHPSRRTHLRSSRVEGGMGAFARGILPRENENERAIVRARKRRCASRARCIDAECVAFWICLLQWVSWITMDRYGTWHEGNEESGRWKRLVRLTILFFSQDQVNSWRFFIDCSRHFRIFSMVLFRFYEFV